MAKSYLISADGSVATVSHFFKTVRENSELAKAHPELAGKKRDDVKFTFVPSATGNEEVDTIVNEALATYGKSLISLHDTNWDYVPSKEEVTITALVAQINKPTARGGNVGLLTKDALALLAHDYVSWAIEAGKKPAAAQTGADLIRGKFRRISGKVPVLRGMVANLESFTESEFATESNAEILAAALELLGSLIESAESVDLDSI